MNYLKQPSGKIKKLTQASKGEACINCYRNNGTTCARHYNGLRQHLYGKGRGIKAHDLCTADLCEECDVLFSEGSKEGFSGDIDRSEQFQHLILLTNIRRFNNGVLKV